MEEGDKKKALTAVGIGASAGGLEALEGFFSQISDESNVSFVVIQHLDPHHNSMMANLLQKQTNLTIQVIEEGVKLAPGTIFLNPPDKNVALQNGHFYLSPINPDNKSFFRIDHFFRSLAEDQGSNAVCIVLSGTGSDGTIGLREVKSSGGMTMVQETSEAGYGGMPNSAINTGLVDVVANTEKMAHELIQYLRHPYMESNTGFEINLKKQQETLNAVFTLLLKQTGHDFSEYKLNTISRRIERRMAVHRFEQLEAYRQYLEEHQAEVEILFKELLITVTSFFRDEDAFEALKAHVLPSILDNLPEETPARAWVPGCATGEEAYTIAMLLVEVMEERDQMVDCKIFASDIDTSSIEFARHGIYPESIKADVSQERLKRFFIYEGGHYKVKKRLRDLVVFANQNLIKDPPFSKVDLVSCRNVLIYMNQDMHKKLLPVFYYALNSGGYLMLGSSESASGFENEFVAINEKVNIFQKQSGALERGLEYPQIPQTNNRVLASTPVAEQTSRQNNFKGLAERAILDNYCYPCVLVNGNYDIIFFYGHTERYLTIPKGKASLNLLNMARQTLQYKLVPALREAVQKGDLVKDEDLQIRLDDEGYSTFDLIIQPLRNNEEENPLLLVVFQEKNTAFTTDQPVSESLEGNNRDQQMVEMEKTLQNTIEQLEISNEELQSKNEEQQATNEELQSSIEELETAKEEAQSTNEELSSVNEELKQKITDLAEANNDINNLLASTEIATIFLDDQLQIKRFTPAMSSIFNLIQSDIGRPIGDITSNVNYKNIESDARHVLETLEKQEKEIQTDSGSWYAVKILPYRTTENIIDGVVITFVDITENKRSEEAHRLAAVVRDSNDAITVLNLNGDVEAWNPRAEQMYGYTEEEALQLNIRDLLPDKSQAAFLDTFYQVYKGKNVSSFQTQRLTKDGTNLAIWITITPLINNAKQTYAIATTEKPYYSL